MHAIDPTYWKTWISGIPSDRGGEAEFSRDGNSFPSRSLGAPGGVDPSPDQPTRERKDLGKLKATSTAISSSLGTKTDVVDMGDASDVIEQLIAALVTRVEQLEQGASVSR